MPDTVLHAGENCYEERGPVDSEGGRNDASENRGCPGCT